MTRLSLTFGLLALMAQPAAATLSPGQPVEELACRSIDLTGAASAFAPRLEELMGAQIQAMEPLARACSKHRAEHEMRLPPWALQVVDSAWPEEKNPQADSWLLAQIMDVTEFLAGEGDEDGASREERYFSPPSPEAVDRALRQYLEQREALNASRLTQAEELGAGATEAAANGQAQDPATRDAPTPAETADALERYLIERDGFGDRPSGSADGVTVFPNDLAGLLRLRESWGTGPEPTEMKVPLAAGASVPLLKDWPVVVPAEDTTPTIIHPLPQREPLVLSPVPAQQVDAALRAYLEQREVYNQGAGIQTVAGRPALSTKSLEELLAQRERWGEGSAGTGPASERQAEVVSGRTDEDGREAEVIEAAGDVVEKRAYELNEAGQDASETAGRVSNEAGEPVGSVGTDAVEQQPARPLQPATAEQEKAAQGVASLPTDSLESALEARAAWGDGPQVTGQSIAGSLAETGGAQERTPVEAGGNGNGRKPVAAVVLEACRTAVSKVAGSIRFRSASARLTGASLSGLAAFAETVKACPGVGIRIGGHTDASGSAEFNQALSQQRAEAVKEALMTAGVDADRLEAKGFGEAQPVASNDTPAGRAQNRRIEFQLIVPGDENRQANVQ